MNKLILLTFAALMACAGFNMVDGLPEELEVATAACKKELEVDLTTKEGKLCVNNCVNLKSGVINEKGVLNPERAKKLAELTFKDPNTQDLVKAIIEACDKIEPKEKDICGQPADVGICFTHKTQEVFQMTISSLVESLMEE